MSTLFPELDIEVVKLTLLPKAGGASVDYYFAQDYWPAGTIYATNPACYPLLAGSPVVKRGVGVWSGIKTDVSIALYADSHLSEFGKTLLDLFHEYEVHNAYADVRYYRKPVSESAGTSGDEALGSTPLWPGIYSSLPSPDGSIDAGDLAHLAFTYRGLWDTGGSSGAALTTHDDAVNIRQTLRVIDTSYDANSGILTLRCTDVWFKNKEVSRRADSNTLTGLDPKWKGEYLATVFGQSTVSGDGIAIDAPFFASGIDGSNRPNAKLFSGWTAPNYPNKAFKRLLVKNQYTDQNKETWVTVALEADPQVAVGDVVGTPAADPPNYARDLTLYARGIVSSPSVNAAKILTAVSADLMFMDAARSADIIERQYFYNNANVDFLSAGDSDFTGEIWISPHLLHTASGNRIIVRQGDVAAGTLEWQLYFNTADDQITFGVSATGTTIGTTAKWSSAASANGLYHIVFRYNSVADQISITVNDGTTVTTSSAAVISRRNGSFSIGSNVYADPGFDGLVMGFRYWNRVLTTGENTTLYNSGSPLYYSALSDTLKQGLRCAYDFNEPTGIRKDEAGSADLTPNSTDSLVSPDIGYSYGGGAPSLTTASGAVQCNVYHAESLSSGNTYNPKAGALREGSVDITDVDFWYSLSGLDGQKGYWNIDPPLVLAPSAMYLTTIDLERVNGYRTVVLCEYDSNGGSSHYARAKNDRAANWAKQNNVRLDLQHFYLGQGDDAWKDGTTSGAVRYGYQHLEAKSVGLAGDQTRVEFNKDLEFKICISGLADDGSGSYTGVANAVIEKPAHIVRFALMNADFGLGLTSAEVDVSSILTAVTDIETAYPNGLKMQIVIDKETSAEELILEICRQARMVFYKKRDGKLALKVPKAHAPGSVYRFSETRHRADLDLVSVADNDYSQVINEFHQFYYVDPVNQPSDAAFIRRNPDEKLANELYITPSGSTAGDGFYTSLCSASQTLYGRREHALALDFYDSPTYAQPVQNYYCARYSKLQRRAKFRIPRRDWFDVLDLFSAASVAHTGIPDAEGTTLKGKAHDAGTPYPAFDEGVPTLIWAGGTLEGQVVEVEEEGAWMTLTVETISPFT